VVAGLQVEGAADIYFIPISLASVGQPTVNWYLTAGFMYIQQNFPYWNQTQGHQHILVMGNDDGACRLGHQRNLSQV